MHIVNLSLIVGLLTSGITSAVDESPTIKAVNDTLEEISAQMENSSIAITPVTPVTSAPVAEEKTVDSKATDTTVISTEGADSATQWHEFVKDCNSLDAKIKTALTKSQLRQSIATEFLADLAKIRAHIQAVKPKSKDIGFFAKACYIKRPGRLESRSRLLNWKRYASTRDN